MKVLVWLSEGTWPSCVDAVRALETPAQLTLLHVVDTDIEEAMHGAYSGLLSRHGHDPARDLEALTGPAEQALLDEAAARLGRPCETAVQRGHPQHEVVAACADFDLLVCARDHAGPGPKSLGRHTRFVVDHAPCAVLLVWP
ncbi:universal stress protein [Amycolatopsis sp. NPDC059657]|uniref:universal stress protein n=1 Tax=Amycolatopsis sp. NPDC059657 TaxID=3346899 RepID=UPI00366CB474